MDEIEILSDDSENSIESGGRTNATMNNMDMFQQMIKLCRKVKGDHFPQKYIDDMNEMYKKCNDTQKSSTKLCNLIQEAIKHVSPSNTNSFPYAASVFNELLQLSSRRDLTSLQTEDCVPGTSNGVELQNGTNNKGISKSSAIFKELIEKCYKNPNFTKSNIEVIDKLYKSLPNEFLDSKYFVQLLKETNQVIWPDSGISFYVHVEHVYKQLLQFKTSMKVQDRKISVENKEVNEKKLIKLNKLKKALKEVRKKIKYLEEKEMDINGDNDFDAGSAYIIQDKYEKRAIQIYKRMCKLADEPDFLEDPPLRYKQTNNSLVNKAIEKFYNLNKAFPDYFEIYTLLQLLNKKKKLNWTEAELKNISHEAFLKLGKQLKVRRLTDYFGRLDGVTSGKDPAEEDAELRKKLEESNKKFKADLNALTEKFENKQQYAEETEGSDLNDTDCENSSEDGCSIIKKQNLNKEFKIDSVNRKRTLSNKSDNDEPPKKSQKTIYMESFDLSPRVVLEKLNIKNIGTNVGVKKGTDRIMVTENINDVKNEKTTGNAKKVSESEDIRSGHKNLENNNVVEGGSLTHIDDGASPFVIDGNTSVGGNTDKTVTKEYQKNEVKEAGKKKDLNISSTTIVNEDSEPMITEPEVIITEGKDHVKDVIEINELDDSDVEITSCDMPKVAVLNKKSLESVIKAMNFEKKYKWDKPPVQGQPTNSRPINSMPINSMPINSIPTNSRPTNSMPTHASDPRHHLLGNLYQNHLNNRNLVNCWVMNNTHRPNTVNNMNLNRPPSMNHRMQSMIQKSMTQTGRQTTQRVMNTMQHQRNFMNNQSVLQQHVTTMTTTTTVRQIVHKSSQSAQRRMDPSKDHCPGSSRSNGNKTPELIELD